MPTIFLCTSTTSTLAWNALGRSTTRTQALVARSGLVQYDAWNDKQPRSSKNSTIGRPARPGVSSASRFPPRKQPKFTIRRAVQIYDSEDSDPKIDRKMVERFSRKGPLILVHPHMLSQHVSSSALSWLVSVDLQMGPHIAVTQMVIQRSVSTSLVFGLAFQICPVLAHHLCLLLPTQLICATIRSLCFHCNSCNWVPATRFSYNLSGKC